MSSYRYYNHNINIKYVDSIIKYVDFKPILYIINLDAVSLYMVFKMLIICLYICIISLNK